MDSKSTVSYMHKSNTQYQCQDCVFFIVPHACVLHGADDTILATGSCNYFAKGEQQLGFSPLNLLTPYESGYMENEEGFSCKRCVHFDMAEFNCDEVDRSSAGDDPGQINPDACCNEWEPDVERARMPQEAFYAR